ncbi:hypothetical protein PENANT_c019G07586 [Penicillium antarcticum]|uniref:Protein kinase domain-containing protein n=1 Tax=Penicillium antarcticum TaxID=416450 RepID=A0A1V6Q0U5_9EURO|nr:hypothetical protein PENANT_c019G07586 [Penicillium antarcticum]
MCLETPPLAGHDGSFEVELEIMELLQVTDKPNPLIIVQVCKAIPEAPPGLFNPGETLVAKVFDPLFVDTEDDILHEFQGTHIPKLYGSFSRSIPVPEQKDSSRDVRLILIELVPGTSMQQDYPDLYSTKSRQKIIKQIIKIETRFYARSVGLTNLAPRNVMMTDDEDPTQLVFLDFGDTYSPNVPKDISPVSRWVDGGLI